LTRTNRVFCNLLLINKPVWSLGDNWIQRPGCT